MFYKQIKSKKEGELLWGVFEEDVSEQEALGWSSSFSVQSLYRQGQRLCFGIALKSVPQQRVLGVGVGRTMHKSEFAAGGLCCPSVSQTRGVQR